MKTLLHRASCATALLLFLAVHTASAAYIIEASDDPARLGLGNFTYTGAGGTAASYSTAAAGNLPATTDATPTFFTLRHAYGGNSATGDEYTFTYSPAVDGDNTAFAAGTLYNSLGAAPDLVSSGMSGGTAGIYNVYRIAPANPGTTAGNSTIYDVSVNGGLQLTQTIDQNAANLATGENVGRWELIGSVALSNNTDAVTVTMTPTPNPIGFVSMRASGIMFEYAAPIPEPSAMVMLGIGSGLILVVRRRLML